ncbi:MAG: phosphatidate cytidylyltransferase [Candidatus Korobacteraceae bacterium]
MKRVLTAVILIPLVVLALFRAPLWLFALLVLGVALLAAREYFDIAEKTGFRPMRGLGYVITVLIFLGYSCGASSYVFAGTILSAVGAIGGALAATIIVVIVLFFPYYLLVFGMRREMLSETLGDAAVSLMLLPYIAIPLFLLVLARPNNGSLFILYLMVMVWCGDIAAYYVGRAIGTHKLAPRISPGKTWEGSIASVVGAVIVGVLLFHYINPIANWFRSAHLLKPPTAWGHPIPGVLPAFPSAPFWFVAVFALCVNVAAQFGDLVESALKRGAGVKDSGTLLPGHGGVLDRIDALLFALPVGLLFYVFGMSRYFEPGGITY